MGPNDVRKTYKLGSCGDLTATISITRVGQQPAHAGDEVVVKGRIILPANEGKLDEKITFGLRALIFGHGLHSEWGYIHDAEDGKGRSLSRTYSAAKWSSAFKEAEECLESELGRLLAAIAAREAALQAAED